MAMTLEQIEQQLEEIRKAKTAILTHSQSHGISSRSLQRVDFAALCKEEQRLETLKDRITNGGITIQYGIRS